MPLTTTRCSTSSAKYSRLLMWSASCATTTLDTWAMQISRIDSCATWTRSTSAQERRVVPETIARFLQEAAEFVPLTLKPAPTLAHAFDPARTPTVLRRYEQASDWRLPALVDRYPRCSTDRDVAEENKLEWVTPGHPLFEAVRIWPDAELS